MRIKKKYKMAARIIKKKLNVRLARLDCEYNAILWLDIYGVWSMKKMLDISLSCQVFTFDCQDCLTCKQTNFSSPRVAMAVCQVTCIVDSIVYTFLHPE